MTKLTAKKLILDLLIANDGQALDAADAIAACALFGFSANATRVALTRLARDGRVSSAGRGRYELGPGAVALGVELGAWRALPSRLTAWAGDYLAAYGGRVPRDKRANARRLERGLARRGFRSFGRDLWLRPANLVGGARAERARLEALGVPPEICVFAAAELSAEDAERAGGLWSGDRLEARYRAQRERLEAWMADASSLPDEDAARESYLLGTEALTMLVFDPWLPAPLVDEEARTSLFDAMRTFDDVGREIWSRFRDDDTHLPIAHGAPTSATQRSLH